MLNQVVMVGRLVDNPNVIEKEGKKYTTITVAVPRAYKNADGVYETDFVNVILWAGIAENTSNYCNKGDLIGIKGRIQTTINVNADNSKSYDMQIVAEKVTFLSSKKINE